MDVSLTCIERNRAYMEQMPHVAGTEACVQGNPGLRAPSQPLRTRKASLCRSVEELREGNRYVCAARLLRCLFPVAAEGAASLANLSASKINQFSRSNLNFSRSNLDFSRSDLNFSRSNLYFSRSNLNSSRSDLIFPRSDLHLFRVITPLCRRIGHRATRSSSPLPDDARRGVHCSPRGKLQQW